jgi:hypothetical protein
MDTEFGEGIDIDSIGHGLMLVYVLGLFAAAGLKFFGLA